MTLSPMPDTFFFKGGSSDLYRATHGRAETWPTAHLPSVGPSKHYSRKCWTSGSSSGMLTTFPFALPLTWLA